MTDSKTPTKPSSKGGKTPAIHTKKECLKTTIIVYVGIDNEGGKPLSEVTISISGPEVAIKQTNDKGKAVFKDIKPGKYKVTAKKDSYIPEPAKKADINAPAGSTKKVKLALSLLEFHMHLDADRDGKVDDDPTGIDVWEWGNGKKGAIILCNNDSDRGSSRSDNSDRRVNSGNDSDEIAPLDFRRTGSNPPADWVGTLEVSSADKKRIRIFNGRSRGSKEIIGPSKGRKYKFKNLNFIKKEFGMEAIKYADSSFNGEISLKFTIKKKKSGSTIIENGVVRVAPWMMPSHLDKAEKVYVVNSGSFNRRFRNELRSFVTSAGCTLQQYPSNDIWMQDCMEWGYSCLPTIGFRSVLRAPRKRPLRFFPKTLRGPDYGYHSQGTLASDTTFDSSGNLEVTPPCTSKAGKEYPFGRIYYGPGGGGDNIDPDLKEFLKKQVVQEPFEIDTSWLLVGHVDEIISTVPAPTSIGFKVLIASPKCAYEILKDNKVTHPTATLLQGREFPETPGINQEITIDEYLNNGLKNLKAKFDAAYLKQFNDNKQASLNSTRQQLENELGLSSSDIIDVPILFGDIMQSGFADAITAGVVNMLVINKHCIFPKPFGPVIGGKDLFEEDVITKLKALGLMPHSIDDWYEYHVNLGEVHCGTNSLREPKTAKWWEYQP